MYDNYLNFHEYFMDPQRIPFLVVAMFITAIAGMISGPLAGNANPFIWGVYNALFGFAGDKLDRPNRKTRDLVFRGTLFVIILLVFALIVSKPMAQFTVRSSAIEGLLVIACLSTGSIWYMMLKLYFTLQKEGKVEGGYFGLARSTRLNLNSVDDFGITREGLAFSAISFDKGLVAPGIWYLIGGVPFIIIYSIVSFASWRFGKQGFTSGFGKAALAVEKLLGYVPSLFSGALYTLASAVAPSANPVQSLKAWWQAKDKVPYEQGGIMLSALAWSLGVSLGGPVRDVSGETLGKVWVGPDGASAKVEAFHLKRGIVINIVAHLIFLLSILSAYVYSGQFL